MTEKKFVYIYNRKNVFIMKFLEWLCKLNSVRQNGYVTSLFSSNDLTKINNYMHACMHLQKEISFKQDVSILDI